MGTSAPVGVELETGPAFRLGPAAWFHRVRRWGGLFFGFASAQGLTQVAGFAAGLLFARNLPVDEFAFYTFASSILVTLAFASDLGTTSALLHFHHRSRTEELPMDVYLSAILGLRFRILLVASPVAVASLLGWGTHRSPGGAGLVIAAAIIVAACWIQVSSSTALIRLRLSDQFGQSYVAEVVGSLTRLGLAVAIVVSGLTLGTAALATALAAVAVTLLVATRRLSVPRAEKKERAQAMRVVLRYLAPTLPGALFFAIQGQLVVWLAATFGGTTSVAQVGALGRLGLAFGFLSTLSAAILLPKLAASATEGDFRRRYKLSITMLSAAALALGIAGAAAPQYALWILGGSYDHLDKELVTVLATALVGVLGGFAVAVNNARSWTRWQVFATVAWAILQVVLVTLLPMTTTMGVLRFGLWSAVFTAAGQLVINLVGLYRPAMVRWS